MKAFFASFVFHSHVIFGLICPWLLLSRGAMRSDSHQERGEGGVGGLGACPLSGGNFSLQRVLGCPEGWDVVDVSLCSRSLSSGILSLVLVYHSLKNPFGSPRRLYRPSIL